eukprot:COSAG04_NODE_1798_length_5553_cov_4.452695_1_plen_128_part_10
MRRNTALLAELNAKRTELIERRRQQKQLVTELETDMQGLTECEGGVHRCEPPKPCYCVAPVLQRLGKLPEPDKEYPYGIQSDQVHIQTIGKLDGLAELESALHFVKQMTDTLSNLPKRHGIDNMLAES